VFLSFGSILYDSKKSLQKSTSFGFTKSKHSRNASVQFSSWIHLSFILVLFDVFVICDDLFVTNQIELVL
jgi:hypothetical protein